MSYNLNINYSNISEKLLGARIAIGHLLGADTRALSDKKYSRYFNIHHQGTYASNIGDQLYAMRQAIAAFAKKNDVTIDIFNPNVLENPRCLESIEERQAKSFHPNTLAFVVSNKINKKMETSIIDIEPSKIFPKEREKFYMVDVPGEDTQLARVAISSTQDTFLRHVFRLIENMTRAVK